MAIGNAGFIKRTRGGSSSKPTPKRPPLGERGRGELPRSHADIRPRGSIGGLDSFIERLFDQLEAHSIQKQVRDKTTPNQRSRLDEKGFITRPTTLSDNPNDLVTRLITEGRGFGRDVPLPRYIFATLPSTLIGEGRVPGEEMAAFFGGDGEDFPDQFPMRRFLRDDRVARHEIGHHLGELSTELEHRFMELAGDLDPETTTEEFFKNLESILRDIRRK